MATAMAAQNLPQLLETVRATQQKASFVLLDRPYPEFIVLPTMFRKNMIKLAGGHTYEFKLKYRIPRTAQVTGINDRDTISTENTWTHGRVFMTHYKNFWTWDKMEELASAGEDVIVDEMKEKRFECMYGHAIKMEEGLLQGPTDQGDALTPWGLSNWLTTRNDGFEGWDPRNVPGFPAGRAMVDSTNPLYGPSADGTKPGHGNYTGSYVNFTYDDLGQLMFRATEKTHFTLPVQNKNVLSPNTADSSWWVNLNTKQGLARMVRNQNDQIGRDLGAYYDTFLVRGIPVKYVSALDAATDNRIYGTKHGRGGFQTLSWKGNVFRETGPLTPDWSHNQIVYWIDVSYQTRIEELLGQIAIVQRPS